jgi:hypothetical protein
MLRIASTADIQGNVHYRSGEIASVDQGAVIRGKLVRTTPPKLPVTSSDIFVFFAAAIAFLVIVSVVSTLILGLLSVRFLPNYHHAAVSILRERPWASLGIGIIAAIVTPVACAALFATVLGIPIAIILMVSYLILLYFGRIFVMSLIGVAILGNRAHTRPGSAFVLGLIVYYVIALIPFLGWLVVLLAILFGLGAELITRKDFYVTARREAMI